MSPERFARQRAASCGHWQRAAHVRERLLLSVGYISVALFGTWVWRYLSAQSGMDYHTGFPIEGQRFRWVLYLFGAFLTFTA